MKEYFVHRFGYLLMDEKNLYFTQSANWSEAFPLKERKGRPHSKELLKVTFVSLFSGCLVWLFLYFELERSGLDSIESAVIWSLIIGVFSAAYSDSKVRHSSFRVPKNKIKNLDCKATNFKISFLNGENKMDIKLLKDLNKLELLKL